jgi:hypothetical protein
VRADGEEDLRRNGAVGDLLDTNKLGKSRVALALFPFANTDCRDFSVELCREGFIELQVVEEVHAAPSALTRYSP